MNIKKKIAEKEEARLERQVEAMKNMQGENVPKKERKKPGRKKKTATTEESSAVVSNLETVQDQSAKADAGKPRLSLVLPQVIFDIAQVREYGNKKYGDPENWKLVEMQRYVDAALRHLYKFVQDPKGKDEESGIEHYKHLACNIAFICEMMAGKK